MELKQKTTIADTNMIKDRQIREMLEKVMSNLSDLESEIENLENMLEERDDEVKDLQEEVSSLKNDIEEYEGRISELEDALAEAYLTSETDNEQTILDRRYSREIGSSKETLDGTGDQS